jgi:hypothetical protein
MKRTKALLGIAEKVEQRPHLPDAELDSLFLEGEEVVYGS